MDELPPLEFEPASFGTILGNGFTLLGRTASNSGILTLLIVIPMSIMFTYGMSSYITAVAEIVATNSNPRGVTPEQSAALAGPLFLFFGIGMISFLATILLQTTTVIYAWEAAAGQRMGIMEGIGLAFRRPFWMMLVQTFLMGIIMMLAFIAFVFLGGAAAIGATEGSGGGSASTILSIILALFGSGVLYFVVATIFRVHRVALEDRGPWHGLIASVALVKGSWWRVLALLIVVYLLVSIPSTLLLMIFLGDDMIDLAHAMQAGTSSDPQVMKEYAATMQALLSWKFILLLIVQVSLVTMLVPNFLTAMYVDLRARRGEIDADDAEGPDETAWGDTLPG